MSVTSKDKAGEAEAEATAEPSPGLLARGAALVRPLRQPAVLLSVAAAVSVLTVSLLAERWQDHQSALDVQTALVSEMTAAATSYALEIDDIHLRLTTGPRSDRPAVNRGLAALHRRWQIKRSVIAARLLAYYGEGSVSGAWGRLASGVQLLRTSAAGGPPARESGPPMSALVGKKVDLRDELGWTTAIVSVLALRDEAVAQVLDATPGV